MIVPRIRLAPLLALLGFVSTSAGFAAAQVPEGSAVVGTFSGPASGGTAGLFLVQVPGGAVTPITGLPPHLTPTGATPTQQGVASVAYRSSDGAILVGTVAAAGGPTAGLVELYAFYLSGSAVTSFQQIPLGTAMAGATAGAWVTVMPDDDILVFAGPMTTGPMVAKVHMNLSTPTTVTPLPTPPGTGGLGGIVLDPTGHYAYYTITTSPGTAAMVTSLYRWDLNLTACVIASWPGEAANGLYCDDDDTVYVSSASIAPPAHVMHAVHPNGCATPAGSSVPTSHAVPPSGLALDRAGHKFLVPAAGFGPGFPAALLNTLSLVDATTGAAVVIAGGPTAWGNMARGGGVAMNNAVDSYGRRSDGQNHYWFDNFPNPGGQPVVGNLGFTLTMQSDPALPQPPVSVLALSLGRSSLQAFGIEVLVDPLTAVLVSTPTTLPSVYAQPIPNNPGLIGFRFTAQSLHIETGGTFAASRGLEITIH